MIASLLFVHLLVVVDGSVIDDQQRGQCLLQVDPKRPLSKRVRELRERDDLIDTHQPHALQAIQQASGKPKGPAKMHKTYMDQDSLAADSRHIHKETYTSDWQDEYPLMTNGHAVKPTAAAAAPILPAKVGDWGMILPAIFLIILFLLVVAALAACMICSRRKPRKHDDMLLSHNDGYSQNYAFRDTHPTVEYHEPVHYHDHQVHLAAHDELRPAPYTMPPSSKRHHSPEYTSRVYVHTTPPVSQEYVVSKTMPPAQEREFVMSTQPHLQEPPVMHEHVQHVQHVHSPVHSPVYIAPMPPLKEVSTPESPTIPEGPILPSTIQPERETVQITTVPPAVTFDDAKTKQLEEAPASPQQIGESRENPQASEDHGGYYHEVAREYL